jgi:hypothetical protein
MSGSRLRLVLVICLVVVLCLAAGCSDPTTSSAASPTSTAATQAGIAATVSTATSAPPDQAGPASTAPTDTATVAATASTTTTWDGPQFPTDLFGFDARQPFIDHDATKALNDPAYKIVTTWVAIGNRQDVPLPFALSDLQLWDAYDHRAPEPADAEAYLFTETVTPIWTPALHEGDIPPHAVVGGYVSWKVPWYVWPMVLDYRFRSEVAHTSGRGIGWQATPLKDIDGRYHYAIGRLFYRGVVKALPDGTFKPYAAITVAQFATMLVLAAAPYNQAAFADDAGYLAEAERAGLATWGSKSAAKKLTRLEVALAVARLANGQLTAAPDSYALPFTDVPSGSENDLALLAYNHVIGGMTATTFVPDAPCSRGQACQMLALLLDPRYREEAANALTIPPGAMPPSGT